MHDGDNETDRRVAAARRFGAEVISPAAEQWQSAGGAPRSLFSTAAEYGLCGLRVPHAAGGSGLDVSGYAAVLETLAAHCLVSTFALVVHNNLAAAIADGGTPTQRDRYLPPMLRGECVGAFALTEPGAGSDATAITTRAERHAGGWTLHGAKAWISNAASADLINVYAQTASGSGARGIAAFLVAADRPGVARVAPYALLGGHALATGGFEFDACELDDDALFSAPGTAFAAAMRAIDGARVGVAAMCCGSLARALAEALAYVGARPAFGGRVGDFQGVQWILAECATDLEAARALTARACAALDAGDAEAPLACAQAKKFATRAAFERIAACMQVMGAAGLSRDYPLARLLEGAKIAQYLDGATEIQNVVIARRLNDIYTSYER